MTQVARTSSAADTEAVADPEAPDASARPTLVRTGIDGVVGRSGPPPRAWARRYALLLATGDALGVIAATVIGWTVRLGFPGHAEVGAYLGFSVLITVGWLGALQLSGGYELRAVSTGARDCQRVLRAALSVAGAAAVVAFFAQLGVGRTFIAIVIPLGALLQMAVRLGVRRRVYAHRRRGEWTSAILAVGTAESVAHLADATRRRPFVGLVVVGACVEDAERGVEIAPGVPVLGDLRSIATVAAGIDADVVAVAGSGLGPRRIRELGWELEGTGRSMVMAPGLTDVAGPRIEMSPVEGLPLMWVEQPQFAGPSLVAKRAMDVLGSALLLTVLSPVLLVIAAVVRATSRGGAIYRSERAGINGSSITVYKFRSMYADADDRRAALLAANDVTGGVLFKLRDDPRVTPVGRILRKFSLDELPQLVNVLLGTMSLVGPRPPLHTEVEQYGTDVHRRLLVKPGMTGLWQVSGRSELSWDETVRLDLYYVENWSLTLDIAIIVRTAWAVLCGRGAY